MKYVHVGVNVTNLEASIAFYKKVFEGNQVNHFGFQVETSEEVLFHKKRLEKEGFFAREEINTTCCYAVQDKFWVTDSDSNEWEFFYTKSDSEVQKIENTSCC